MTELAMPATVLPDGIEILPPDADRAEWLAARRAGIGGSEIASLFGEGYDSEYRVWLDKLGLIEEEYAPGTPTWRGRWLEPHLADLFAEQVRLEVRPCGLVQNVNTPEMIVTPDRLVEGQHGTGYGLLEIKSMSSQARDSDGQTRLAQVWRRGQVPLRVWYQGQYQLAVTGLEAVWFLGYEIDQPPIVLGPFDRDERLIAEMRERVTTWWDAHIVRGDPPPVDLARLDEDEAALRWPHVTIDKAVECDEPYNLMQLLERRAQLASKASGGRKADSERKKIDVEIKALVGDAAGLTIGGTPVITCNEQNAGPQVDASLEHDHPEIWAQYVTVPRYRAVRVVKGWQDATPEEIP
jgi:predicted phage-related endonuclease